MLEKSCHPNPLGARVTTINLLRTLKQEESPASLALTHVQPRRDVGQELKDSRKEEMAGVAGSGPGNPAMELIPDDPVLESLHVGDVDCECRANEWLPIP